MDAYQIFLTVLTAIVIGISVFLVVKKSKQENWDPNQVLESILEQILDLCKSTLEILKLDRDDFESEEAFKARLATIVSKKIRALLEQTGTSETLLKVLTEEVITEFIINVFARYSREIGLERVELEYKLRLVNEQETKQKEEQKVDMIPFI